MTASTIESLINSALTNDLFALLYRWQMQDLSLPHSFVKRKLHKTHFAVASNVLTDHLLPLQFLFS